MLVGFIATLAWPLSIASGRIFGQGITAPSANIVQYLVIGDDKFINWGVFLVLGIFLGAFIAAKSSGEFRLRAADTATSMRSCAGGILMGFGATAAGECSHRQRPGDDCHADLAGQGRASIYDSGRLDGVMVSVHAPAAPGGIARCISLINLIRKRND